MAGAGRGWQNKWKSSGNAPVSSPGQPRPCPGHWPGRGHPPLNSNHKISLPPSITEYVNDLGRRQNIPRTSKGVLELPLINTFFTHETKLS